MLTRELADFASVFDRSRLDTVERTGAEIITDERLLEAAEDARVERRQKTLEALMPHQRVIYDIVRTHGPLAPSAIHTRYQTDVNEPRRVNGAIKRVEQRGRERGIGHDEPDAEEDDHTRPAEDHQPPM